MYFSNILCSKVIISGHLRQGADNIAVAFFEMINKLLDVVKSVDIESVMPVTQPAEDLQVLPSTTGMTLEMIPDLLNSSDPLEVADLAFGPGEAGERVREDNVADLVKVDTKMFQLEMP